MDDVYFDPILGELRSTVELERIVEQVQYYGGGAGSPFNLSEHTTDELPEGSTNLYSQWEKNTYTTYDYIQPKNTANGLVIGSDLHSSLSGYFPSANAWFNGSIANDNQGINYFINVGYGSGFAALGGVFVGGRARGTPAIPTQTLAGDYLMALGSTGFDGSGWATSSGNGHILPGFYFAAASDVTGGILETDIWLGDISSKMISFETDTNNIKFNEAQVDSDITFYYYSGVALAIDGDTGNITAGALNGTTANSLANIDTVQTFTNKRISQRIEAVSDATSITPNWDSYDMTTQANTQVAGTLTINAPTYATANNGDERTLRIKSTNAQTFSFNAIYRGSTDTPTPVSTYAGSTTIYMKFKYNSGDTKWDLVSVTDGY